MRSIWSTAVVCGYALMFSFRGGLDAQAARDCRDVNYSTERAKLEKLLSKSDFSQGARSFLMKQVDLRVMEVPESSLNARGVECGIRAVRAQILACLNHVLPETLKEILEQNQKTGKTAWGKVNVSNHELVFIGIFHACRGSAMEVFLSGDLILTTPY